jgi:hypothetical protein
MWGGYVDRSRYTLLNSPFFVKGVSYLDVVSVKEVDGVSIFDRVEGRGGHSTYRLVPQYATHAHAFVELWRSLQEIGCTYEEAHEIRMLAVDVPETTDIYEVYGVLERGLALDVWDFEEGHCGHPLRDL